MKRVQVFCIGASTLYGVGSTKGGLPDLLKQELHSSMYGSADLGETHEVYNLAVPGAVIGDLAERCQLELKTISKPGRLKLVIVQLGANNAKAIDRPDNYVSTPEEYRQEAFDFLSVLKKLSDVIVCMGLRPMDQAKVMPIVKDKEKNRAVYFPNERLAQFEKILGEVTESLGIKFIPMFEELAKKDPEYKLGWRDGIHPNDAGHRFMYEKVRPMIMELLGL
jgi:lysophospholipase L1-like esterase